LTTSSENSENGGGERAADARHSMITVRKDWDTFKLTLKMTVPTLQDAKAILQQALDEVDAQIRLGRVQQMAQEAAENARVQAILNSAGKERRQ